MVLMPRPYKDDKQLEQEMKNSTNRMVAKHVCTRDGYKEHKEEPGSIEQIAKKFFKRVSMQEGTIRYLLETVTKQEKMMQEMKENFERKVVVVEEIPKEEAKKRIENYFIEHEHADIEELMVNLQIPVHSIVEIIDELRNDGKLVPQGENSA